MAITLTSANAGNVLGEVVALIDLEATVGTETDPVANVLGIVEGVWNEAELVVGPDPEPEEEEAAASAWISLANPVVVQGSFVDGDGAVNGATTITNRPCILQGGSVYADRTFNASLWLLNTNVSMHVINPTAWDNRITIFGGKESNTPIPHSGIAFSDGLAVSMAGKRANAVIRYTNRGA